jgi:signal transduction histidine kinase
MRVVFRDRRSGAWRDANRQPVTWPPAPGPGRTVTTAGAGPLGPEVALVHDVALCDDQELLDGVSSMVLAGWRHEQLMLDLSRAMSELADSRQRIAKAADIERARMERDLHDGAQQRLIALGLRLELAEEKLKRDPEAAGADFHDLGLEVERSLDELRSLAHGVYPSMLLDRGLAEALRSLTIGAPVPIHVISHGVTRHGVEIESAVYFACAEAAQNAMKHAAGRKGISITLEQSERLLRFEVRDHGPGFTPGAGEGRGLRNMRDRMEAIGGQLTIDTQPGHGTCVIGSLELPFQGPTTDH